jgi:hypothetical protein
MTDKNGVVEIKDFTLPQGNQPKKFRIDGDVFQAVATIPLNTMQDLAGVRANLGDTQDAGAQLDAMRAMFKVILLDDSWPIFETRMGDKLNPIGQEHLMPLMDWLLESYGLRPTVPSSGSSTGSDDGDGSTSSTDGVSVVELTSPNSLLPAS